MAAAIRRQFKMALKIIKTEQKINPSLERVPFLLFNYKVLLGPLSFQRRKRLITEKLTDHPFGFSGT